MTDEENFESEGRGGLVCRTQVRGTSRRFSRQSQAELAPGSVIRVSVGSRGNVGKSLKKVARILAFVHPMTGKLVVRMGMYDISKSTHGCQEGPQVTWESDVPVYKVKE